MDVMSWCCVNDFAGSAAAVNVTASSEEIHRIHHALQIRLVSPFLFTTKYGVKQLDKWIQDAGLVTTSDCVSWNSTQLGVDVYRAIVEESLKLSFDVFKIVSPHIKNSNVYFDEGNLSLSEFIAATKIMYSWISRIFKRFEARQRDQVEALLAVAIYLFSSESLTASLKKFDSRIAAGEESAKFFLMRGDLKFKCFEIVEAIEQYSAGLAVAQYSDELYLKRAICYLYREDLKKAEDDSMRAVFLRCDCFEGYKLLIDVAEKRKDRKKVYKLIEIAQARYEEKKESKNVDWSERNGEKTKKGQTDDKDGRINCNIKKSANRKDNGMPVLISDSSENEERNDGAKMKENLKVKKRLRRSLSMDTRKAMDRPLTSAKSEEKIQLVSKVEKKKVVKKKNEMKNDDSTSLQFPVVVRDATKHFLDGRYSQATEMYSDALRNLIEKKGEQKEINLIKFALGMCCIELNSLSAFSKSIHLFDSIIKEFPLAHYGLSLSYYKQFRFKEALEAIERGLSVCNVEALVYLGELNWPRSNFRIELSEPGKLNDELKKLSILCCNPPKPDAICRYEKCSNHLKREIYLIDPNCKGAIKINCSENCCLQYHLSCWKKMKHDLNLVQSTDKNVLNTECWTPDCIGKIIKLIHINERGEETKSFTVNSDEILHNQVSKHRMSKLEKKLMLKETKKRNRRKSENSEGNIKEEPPNVEEVEEEIVKEKAVERKCASDTKIPTFKANKSNLPISATTSRIVILKKDDYGNEEMKNERRTNKNKEKKKKKIILPMDEFFQPPEDNDAASSNEYIKRIQKLKKEKEEAETVNGWRSNVNSFTPRLIRKRRIFK